MDSESNDIRFERATLASMFLGPQAENADFFERLILYVLRDYVFWRRNFQPEDPFVIREIDKIDEVFVRRSTQLQQKLVDLLGKLKGDNIPFASPRYVGHMLSDQLLPALIGYFAAMLYNPNNVTQEASPQTTVLEEEVQSALAELVGYESQAWGHICSGGTVANLEALWVARNAKWLPASLVLLKKDLAQQGVSFDMEFPFKGGTKQRLSTLSLWELCNLDLRQTIELFEQFRDELASKAKWDKKSVTRKIRAAGLAGLGVDGFFVRLRKEFADDFEAQRVGSPISGRLIVPSTCHYSVTKVAEVLGLGGRNNILRVPIDSQFRMRADKLESSLQECLNDKIPVIAVVSVCGSTEEASIDPIDEVERLKDKFSKQGLSFVHHCDAAYGGYARTMLCREGGADEWPAPKTIASRLKIDSANVLKLQQAWPPAGVTAALRAIPFTDSVTIDPHKLGYVPYPAGAILFRQGRAKEFISFDPAYLEQKVIGGYILEGSKPGAAAAACWLAIQCSPLHERRHGIVIGRSIKNSYNFAESLMEFAEELAKQGVKLSVVNYPSDLNIVCFIFNISDNSSLWKMNAYSEYIFDHYFKFDRNKALSQHQFILSYTRFSQSDDSYPLDAVKRHLEAVEIKPSLYQGIERQLEPDDGSDDHIFVFRATTMNPWLAVSVDVKGEMLARDSLQFIKSFLSVLKRAIAALKESDGRNDAIRYVVQKREKGDIVKKV